MSRRTTLDEHPEAKAETPSITRLEGSRWRGGRLWSWNRDSRAWAGADRAADGARARSAPTRVVVRAPTEVGVRGSICGLTHTPPETWAPTRSKTPVPTVSQAHEVSKLQVRVVSWSAERIGPMRIAAPQRGQAQVAHVGVFGGAGVVASGIGRASCRERVLDHV